MLPSGDDQAEIQESSLESYGSTRTKLLVVDKRLMSLDAELAKDEAVVRAAIARYSENHYRRRILSRIHKHRVANDGQAKRDKATAARKARAAKKKAIAEAKKTAREAREKAADAPALDFFDLEAKEAGLSPMDRSS